jgi:nucleotide-binding universal stress UspA family protein
VDVDAGSASSRIVARARELEADLIVMGAHGRSGFAQRFMGTTTERVVRKAHCSVLAVTLPMEE